MLITSFEGAPRAFHNAKRFERRRHKAGGGGSVLFGGEARERAKKLDLLKKRLPQKVLRNVRRTPKLLDLGAETRNMTFLVCRIRGFAAIVHSFANDPEGLSRLVRRG
jgi:adenylate cyclase